MGIIHLIANSNFIAVNKEVAKKIGLDEAIMLGELASEYDYWEKRGELEDGYFYSTVENVENSTTLSDYRQRKALKTLQSFGLVVTKAKGIPAKRYIKIIEAQVMALFDIQDSSNLTSSSEKIKELAIEELDGNKNRETRTTTRTNKEKGTAKRFTPPTVDEVRAYCQERQNGINAEHFIDYYEARGWELSKGRKIKDWKACIRTWERNSYGNTKAVAKGPNGVKVTEEPEDDYMAWLREMGEKTSK